jgi:hypothetical protein
MTTTRTTISISSSKHHQTNITVRLNGSAQAGVSKTESDLFATNRLVSQSTAIVGKVCNVETPQIDDHISGYS